MEPIAIQSWIFIFASFFVLSNADGVPVLLWANYKIGDLQSSVGSTVAAKEFESYLTSASKDADQTVVISLDKLSVDDLTAHSRKEGDHMNKYNDDKLNHAAFASVSDGYSTVRSMLGQADEVPTYALSSFAGKKGIVSVDDVASAFGTLDELIPLARSEKKMLMIITGKEKGVVKRSLSRIRRADDSQVTASTNGNETRMLIADAKNCVLLYIGGLDIVYVNETFAHTKSIPLDDVQGFTFSAECTNSTASLNLTFTAPYSVSIEMNFNLSNAAEWFLTEAQVTASLDIFNNGSSPAVVSHLTGAPLPLTRWLLWAPMGFSFHCTESIQLPRANRSADVLEMTLKNFQLQMFFGNFGNGNSSAGFGPANDCAYFFSAGVWMGLMAGAVMLAILSCGIFMVSDIKTMDQFDDPKRTKLLSVPQTD